MLEAVAFDGGKQPRLGDQAEREPGTKSFHLPPLLPLSCRYTLAAKLNPKLEGSAAH